VVANLFRDRFDEARDGGLNRGIGGEIRTRDRAPPPVRTTIFPLRRLIMCGSTARQAFITPSRLVFTTSAQAFGAVSTNGPMGPCTPAAQISTWTGPQSTRTRSTEAHNCS
jgi:hypothetical protein